MFVQPKCAKHSAKLWVVSQLLRMMSLTKLRNMSNNKQNQQNKSQTHLNKLKICAKHKLQQYSWGRLALKLWNIKWKAFSFLNAGHNTNSFLFYLLYMCVWWACSCAFFASYFEFISSFYEIFFYRSLFGNWTYLRLFRAF